MSKYGRSAVKGFLHTQGTKIVNGDNEEIILEGYGVGNWVNPEGFMIGHPSTFMGNVNFDKIMKGEQVLLQPDRFDRRRSVTSTVRELCGDAYMKDFWDRWQDNHLGEADIKAMADLDLNSVRLVLNANVLVEDQPGITFIEPAFERLGKVLDWCEKYGIYAILDMHAAPGGQAGSEFDDGYDLRPHLFYNQDCWERCIALWEELAKRFGDRWIVGGYDLLNEPISSPVDKSIIPLLGKFYDECIAVIRKHDKKHMFLLEPQGFSRNLITFDHEYDPGCHNYCINWHRYGFSPEIKEISPYLLKSQEYNVPVWIGEGGSSPEANAVFFNIVQEYGVGYCLWCWKTATKADDKSPLRNVGHVLPKDWDLMQSYFTGGPKPTYAQSQKILDEYLENMKYEKCVKNFDNINRTRRIVPFDLPAVGYDHSEKNGETFVGSFGLGNLLNYRTEDHTKLIWDKRFSEPTLWIDAINTQLDPVRDNRNPMTRLLLELAECEFAVYFLRKAPNGTVLSIDARSPEGAIIEIQVDGKAVGTIDIPASDVEINTCEQTVAIPACEEVKIKIVVKKGIAQLHKLHFN